MFERESAKIEAELVKKANKKISIANEDEVKATISTGLSINHLITLFIALFGGWVWQALGMELLFIASAILGLCNSAYAASIKTAKKNA